MEWMQENLGIVITVIVGIIGVAATIFYAANRNKVIVKAKGNGAKAEYTGGNKITAGDGSPVYNIDAKGPVTIGGIEGGTSKKKDRK